MASHTDLVALASAFAGRYPTYGGDVADWLSWCLPRGIDASRPAPLALATYERETKHDIQPLHTWLRWCGPRRPPTPPPTDQPPHRQQPPEPHLRATPPDLHRRPHPNMLTTAQTIRLLRYAARRPDHPATVALFLLAADGRIRPRQISSFDVTDIDTVPHTQRISLRLAGGPPLILPPVVAEHLSAHLAAHPRARQFTTYDGRTRVPLLRNRTGGRTTAASLSEGIRRIAATADPELRAQTPRITPGQIQVVNLTDWYNLPL
jgi:integrase